MIQSRSSIILTKPRQNLTQLGSPSRTSNFPKEEKRSFSQQKQTQRPQGISVAYQNLLNTLNVQQQKVIPTKQHIFFNKSSSNNSILQKKTQPKQCHNDIYDNFKKKIQKNYNKILEIQIVPHNLVDTTQIPDDNTQTATNKSQESQQQNDNKLENQNNPNNKLLNYVTHLNKGDIFAGKSSKQLLQSQLNSSIKFGGGFTSSPQNQRRRVGFTPQNMSLSIRNSKKVFSFEKKEKVYYMTNLQNAYKLQQNSDYFTQIYKEHFIQTYQSMLFCKMLKSVNEEILQQKIKKLNIINNNIKTIVFDLDETLIHCNESTDIPSDIILPIQFPTGEIIHAGINMRPYAREILRDLSQIYEIIVFTASHECYANVVLDYLDSENKYISHRLFRDDCISTEEGVYIKDLQVLGNRELQNILIVDNAAYSFGFQIENGVPIIPFYDNKLDTELLQLKTYLMQFQNVNDTRDINNKTFQLNEYTNSNSLESLIAYLFG